MLTEILRENIKVSRKGLQLAWPTFFGAMLALVVMLILFYLAAGRFFDINTEVVEATIDRHAFTLANVLLSSDSLAYSDGITLMRGTLDKEKLDSVQINPNSLFGKIGYPASTSDVTVTDLETNNKWFFSGDGPASSVPVDLKKKTYQVTFPIVIRYPDSDIHAGTLTLKLTENLLK